MELLVPRALTVPPVLSELLARVLLVPRVPKDLPAHKVYKVLLVPRVPKDLPAHKDQQALPGQKVPLGYREYKVLLAQRAW
jgi:hypothetical protein